MKRSGLFYGPTPPLGNAVTEADVMALVERLRQAGGLSIGDEDAVTYND